MIDTGYTQQRAIIAMQPANPQVQLRRKREMYRRSQTLGAIPSPPLSMQRSSTKQRCQQATELASTQSQPSTSRTSSSSCRTSRSSVGSSSASGERPRPSTTKTTKHLLGRTPSSPSLLLSRMRELIREKVMETTADRNDLAAMERERRQRAADAFSESLRRHRRQQQQQEEHQPQPHRHSSGSVDVCMPPYRQARSASLYTHHSGVHRRYRIRSDPASSRPRRFSPSPDTLAGDIPLQLVGRSAEGAKSAFREYRSTSEDTTSRRRRTSVTFDTTRRLSHDVVIGHRSKG